MPLLYFFSFFSMFVSFIYNKKERSGEESIDLLWLETRVDIIGLLKISYKAQNRTQEYEFLSIRMRTVLEMIL